MIQYKEKLIQQKSAMYGYWWIRIYQIQSEVTLGIMTVSKGEPEKEPLRVWWGQMSREDELMKDFQEMLKSNTTLSPYLISWSDEMLGEGIEMMSFYEKDFKNIFELITKSLVEYKAYKESAVI